MIRWADIEAECDGYREGFVAVFRRHEGEVTDERDEQNRAVKVTATSFARHMGIPEPTFRGWTRTVTHTVLPEQRDRMEVARARKAIRQASPEARREIVREVAKTDLDAVRDVWAETVPRVEWPERKAAEAAASEAVEPLRRALDRTVAAMALDALREARDGFMEAMTREGIPGPVADDARELMVELARILALDVEWAREG